MIWLRKMVLEILALLRQSRLRRPLTRLLVWLHNWSYHLIAFFASHSGQHPKHDIQRYHEFFVQNVTPSDRVLDVGSGHGDVSFDVAKKAKNVVGIDISAKNIALAQNKYARPNLSFIVGDALTHVFPQPFDVIILSNVLEHIEHRVDFLKKLSAIAPALLIRVPMITRDWISVYKKNEGFEYRLDDTHFIEYDEPTFTQEIQEVGLTIDHQHVTFGELYAVVRRAT
jgi:SAM-dependent methyltransferase